MKCPVCDNNMVEEDFGDGVMVDVCEEGCNGIWFDWKELEKLNRDYEGNGEALKRALESPRVSDEERGKIDCPKCSMPMSVHKYRSEDVTVDQCYLCGGFFLDSGEFKAIRETFMGEHNIGDFVNDIVAEIPDETEHGKSPEKPGHGVKDRKTLANRLHLLFSHIVGGDKE